MLAKGLVKWADWLVVRFLAKPHVDLDVNLDFTPGGHIYVHETLRMACQTSKRCRCEDKTAKLNQIGSLAARKNIVSCS